jgi:hypothetical protein
MLKVLIIRSVQIALKYNAQKIEKQSNTKTVKIEEASLMLVRSCIL